MILVIGSTGTTGREVAGGLAAAGAQFRLLVRDPKKIASARKFGAEIKVGSLEEPDKLAAAMQGVEKVFLLTSAAPNQVEIHRSVYEAAKRAGARHVVRMSAIGAAQGSPVPLADWHGRSEKDLESSGLAWTHLRPHYFMQNTLMFASTIAVKGMFFAPMKNGAISMVDVRDIAAVAVKALTEPGHEGKTYEITGPEALTFHQVAEKVSKALGKEVRYADVDPEDARRAMLSAGLPDWLAGALVKLYGVFSEGKASFVTDTVERVTGKKPRTYDQFAQEFAVMLRGQ